MVVSKNINYKVSIIVPCYNQAQFLEEALLSVLNQTYQNWECIIINDGSKDNTEKIALSWCKRDNRFKYIYKNNGGLSSARNSGLDIAKGTFIQFLDCDDIIDSSKLNISISILNRLENNKPKIVISNFRMFTEDIKKSTNAFCELSSKYFNLNNILLKWDIEFNIPIHCAIFSNSLFDFFRFPEELKAKEDWIMWVSLFQKTPIIHFVNQPLAFYRLHQNSMTRNNVLMNENLIKSMLYLDDYISEKDYVIFFEK